MKTSLISTILTLFLVFFSISAFTLETRPKINLIYKHTGFGLGRDAAILSEELRNLGYSVQSYKIRTSRPIAQADINIFLEEVNLNFFCHAKKNYLIPNPEWFLEPVSVIPQFDMILCKTRECERIFKQYHSNAVFMGFTSIDRYDPSIEKNYRQALHVAGKSQQKGTDKVVQAWADNPQLPGLLFFRHTGKKDYTAAYNIRLFYRFIEDEKLIKIQNKYALHLCPSETEGFGQYLMEALSCGAIPITTDAPPMNEFVTDKRCLVGYTHTSEQHLATNYYVDPIQLGQVVDNLMQLSDDELAEIGKKNRKFYLDSKRQFQQRIREIFSLTPDTQ